MKDRIIKFLTHENLTATKFADEIGVQRSSVSHILSGRNNPSFDFIQRILSRYKNLSSEWLLMGTGNMLKRAEQMDLFAEASTSHGTSAPNVLKQPDKTSPPENENLGKSIIETEKSSSKKVDKILIFYSDKTFDEFLPSTKS
jgi:transcriptional regulator with XRE-family HTH domain